MNEPIMDAWVKVVDILRVSLEDIRRSRIIENGGVYLKPFLRLINDKLTMAGTEKSLEFLEAILPVYPPIAKKSVEFSRKKIDSYIQSNTGTYEAFSIPYEFIISEEEPAVVDLLGALHPMVTKGLDISGIKVLYADSAETLQIILYLDAHNYSVLSPDLNNAGVSHEASMAFINSVTPVVRCNGLEYRLHPMKDGLKPWKILNYCWKNKLGKEVSRDELKSYAKINGKAGISEILRKSPQAQLLSPFMEVTAASITLRTSALLSDDELKYIISESEKPIPTTE